MWVLSVRGEGVSEWLGWEQLVIRLSALAVAQLWLLSFPCWSPPGQVLPFPCFGAASSRQSSRMPGQS